MDCMGHDELSVSRLDNSRSVGDEHITSFNSICAPKTKIEHKNRGLEDYFPFQRCFTLLCKIRDELNCLHFYSVAHWQHFSVITASLRGVGIHDLFHNWTANTKNDWNRSSCCNFLNEIIDSVNHFAFSSRTLVVRFLRWFLVSSR